MKDGLGVVLIDYFSNEIDAVDEWVPEYPELEVGYYLSLDIRPPNGEVPQNFAVTVLNKRAWQRTKKFVDRIYKINPHAKFLVVEPYSWHNLIGKINGILKACEGKNWEESLKILRKSFHWDFEGLVYLDDDGEIEKIH